MYIYWKSNTVAIFSNIRSVFVGTGFPEEEPLVIFSCRLWSVDTMCCWHVQQPPNVLFSFFSVRLSADVYNCVVVSVYIKG